MFCKKFKTELGELRSINDSQLALFTALNRSMATIEFEPDGTIRNANENFLSTAGYSLKRFVDNITAFFVNLTMPTARNIGNFGNASIGVSFFQVNSIVSIKMATRYG